MFEIGNTLREARRRQGLDLAACEAATKIRVKYLAAMEEEQFEVLPEPAYVRGFLRAYADFLGVDTRLVMEEYASRDGEDADEAPPAQIEPPAGPIGGAVRKFVAPRPRRKRRASTLRWLALGGVLTLALLIWAGVGSNRNDRMAIPEPEPEPAPAPARTPVQPAAPTPAAAVRPVASLDITGAPGTRGSYVQVRRRGVEGPLLFEGTVRPGTHKRWRGALWVRVGWTPSLRARVNGRPATLEGGTANFTIDRTGARPAA